MTSRTFAILDPSAGISGDMLLGALLAAGAPLAWLEALPARLGLEGVTIRVHPVSRCGVSAMKVDVVMADGSVEGPHDEAGLGHPPHQHPGHSHHHAHDQPHQHPDEPRAHGHEGHHHGPHRRVSDLIRLIEAAPLSPWVRERAVQAFRLLGEHEGAIHGVAPDQVVLHEVGALDALIDIVGGIEGFEQLGISRIFNRPVAVGSGWVRAAHGTMAVPAPVTIRLLEGVEIGPDGPVTGEATTPTGAVLLRVLSQGRPPSGWKPVASGWGAGGRNPEQYPNALRLIVVESGTSDVDVVTLTTDIDDLSPEYLEPLRTALTAAGALDVQVWSTMGKKGRVGFRVEAVASAGAESRISAAFFRHSTTAGVRWSTGRREVLPRREISIAAPGGDIRVKILETSEGPRVKPEYDDVVRVAGETGRPAHELAREIQKHALDMLSGQSVRSADT
ncbi:MAG: LarC family nickel insertion protein [Gemmatimonadota bacterium]